MIWLCGEAVKNLQAAGMIQISQRGTRAWDGKMMD